jgi:hypothetical protein
MGLNPYRRFVARRADYLLVVVTLLVIAVLVFWALFA